MPERKRGIIKGFLTCDEDYLKLIAKDLDIEKDLPIIRLLQKLYAGEKKEPTVTQLLFDIELMKSSTKLYDSELISDIKSEDGAATELFSYLSAKASDYASRRKAGLSLCALAQYACQTENDVSEGTFTLFERDYPEFKKIPGSESAFFEAGAYVLRHEKGVQRAACESYKAGLLIYPAPGCSAEEYWKKADEFAKNVMDEDPGVSVIPMTRNGFLRDIASSFASASVFVNELPGNLVNPEDVLKSFCPGFILRINLTSAKSLKSFASSVGLNAFLPVVESDTNGQYRIYSSCEPISITSSHIENARLYRRNVCTVRRSELKGKGKLDVCSSFDCNIIAQELKGYCYSAIASNMKAEGEYCIAGTLAPQDAASLDFIISLYSFVSNNNVKIRSSYFTVGQKTDITLFSLGVNTYTRVIFKACPSFAGTSASVGPVKDKEINTSEYSNACGESDFSFRTVKNTNGIKNIRVFENLAEICGNTPMLRLYPELGAQVYAKLEMFNPAGSAKDRVALEIIRSAEASGELKKGGTIIEATSGNTGIGLACYGVALGYKVIIIMPDTMSAERIALIKAYGAEVRLTPGAKGMSGANELAAELIASIPDSYAAKQFSNPSNPRAHEKTTGPEIWRDLNGKVDFLIAGVGTGGTLCGSAAYLKRMNPDIKIIACEPASSPLLSGGPAGPHKIQGIGANFIPDNYNASVIDAVMSVSDKDAISETVNIARTTGLLCGISSGCAAYAAKKIAAYPGNAGKVIAVILPDTGEHYLSTGIFA